MGPHEGCRGAKEPADGARAERVADDGHERADGVLPRGCAARHVETAVADVKKALEGTDVEAIKSATEKLQQSSYKLAEIVYQQGAAGASAGEDATAEATTGEGGEDVVDADYEVVDDGDES